MSEVRLVLRDASRAINGTIHGSVADSLVAALSAEPETIEELDRALQRFIRSDGNSNFAWFSRGDNDEPYDAGLVVIDLAARLIVCDSTYSSPGQEGYVAYHDGHSATDVDLRYHLPDDWKFTKQVEGWQSLAEDRRRYRAAEPPQDTRAILYDRPLVEFITRECWAAFPSLPLQAASAVTTAAADAEDDGQYAIVRSIHARWLMTPRDDLRGRTPREVLHEKHKSIEWDMQDRCEQWSRVEECPPTLDPQSHAYRFAGYGTHEIVMYYDLVRHLLWECRDLCSEFRASTKSDALMVGDFLTTAVPRLERLRDEWLDAPDSEFHGRTPRSIIENERRRLPEVMSRGEVMIDDDCPLCQMAADMPGPTFWHLDGCNMDDEFAFSIFYSTREEWDEEQRRYQEFNRKYAEREAERERLGVKYPGRGYADADYVWQRSFVAPESEETSPLMRLFSIGFSLSELTCDLKDPAENRELIDALSRDFGNLREVAHSKDGSLAAALLDPVVDRFCETLDNVARARDDLRAKCANLQERLRRFLDPPIESDSSFDPFESSDDLELPF